MTRKTLDLFCFTIWGEETWDPYIDWQEIKAVIKEKIWFYYYLDLVRFLVKSWQHFKREWLEVKKLKEFLEQH